jgi:benzoate-CoA ligase family protein
MSSVGTGPAFNVATALLDRPVRTGHGDREAIRADGRRWTYREVLALVEKFGNGLADLGVRPGDRVVVLLGDSVEFAVAYFGTMRTGAVAVLCNPALRQADFELFIKESDPKVVVVEAAIGREVLSALHQVEREPFLAAVRGAFPGASEWESWLARFGTKCEPYEASGENPAFWLWTSGSTGHPRAAIHRHRDWGPCIEGYAKGVLRMNSTDTCFSAAKAFHAYGLGNGTVFPLAVGARTVYLRGRPTPEAVFSRLVEDRPTLFFGVPTMYAQLLAHADREAVPELPVLRHCVSAGEPLPGELYRRWHRRFGIEILDGIGSTEVLHIYLSARAGKVRPGSVGAPVEGYAVRVVDEHHRDVPVGQLGDLWVRAPSLAAGYHRGSGESPLRLHDGWFDTGDKLYGDADGFYWYVGRADDMFKSSAEWVSPTVVESRIIEHPMVLESAVVGRTDSNGLLRPRAFVVLKPGHSPTEELRRELQGWLRDRLPHYAVPHWLEFLPDLPKSSTGKLLRYQLRKRELPRAETPPGSSPTSD